MLKSKEVNFKLAFQESKAVMEMETFLVSLVKTLSQLYKIIRVFEITVLP